MGAIFVVLTILVFLAVDYFVLRSQLRRMAEGEPVRSVGLIPIRIDETMLNRRPRYPLHDKGFEATPLSSQLDCGSEANQLVCKPEESSDCRRSSAVA